MKRRFRLTQSADIKRVRQYGKTFAHPLVVLIILANQVGPTRIAVIAGRSLGKAVKRNRAKRLIRAALLPYLEFLKPGWDILLITRQPFAQTDLSTAQEILGILFKRANLIKNFDDNP